MRTFFSVSLSFFLFAVDLNDENCEQAEKEGKMRFHIYYSTTTTTTVHDSQYKWMKWKQPQWWNRRKLQPDCCRGRERERTQTVNGKNNRFSWLFWAREKNTEEAFLVFRPPLTRLLSCAALVGNTRYRLMVPKKKTTQKLKLNRRIFIVLFYFLLLVFRPYIKYGILRSVWYESSAKGAHEAYSLRESSFCKNNFDNEGKNIKLSYFESFGNLFCSQKSSSSFASSHLYPHSVIEWRSAGNLFQLSIDFEAASMVVISFTSLGELIEQPR